MPIKEKGQNATQVANKDVSTTAPTDGQVLTYSSSAGEWAPATPASGSASFPSIDDQGSSNDDQLTLKDTEVVINIDKDTNVDFRVAGDSDDNVFFCDSSTDRSGFGTITPDTQVEVVKASANAEVAISCYHDTEATTPKLTFRKADNTEASPALVDDNAVLGTVSFQGHDGSGFHEGAKVEARIQGTPSDGTDMPTELTFWTTPDASGAAVERMAIAHNGGVGIGTVGTVIGAAGLEITKDLGAPDDLSAFSDYHLVLKGGYDNDVDYAAMLFSSSVDGNGGSAIVHYDTGGTGKGELAFLIQKGTSGAAPVEVLRLKDDGRGVSDFTASAWCNIDGENATPAVRDSHNVSSITDRATGKLTASFTVAMGDANFAAVVGAHGSSTGELSLGTAHNLATGSVQVSNRYAYGAAAYYDADFYLVIFGG